MGLGPVGRRLEYMLGKRGRVVECTGLENRRRFTPSVSSNLTASAKYCQLLVRFYNFNKNNVESLITIK